MARTTVTYRRRGDRIPFLRGLLTQSLVDIGLSFKDAYAIASTMRDELHRVPEIAAHELRGRVADLLERLHGPELRQRYEAGPVAESPIQVVMDGRTTPFVVSTLARSLQACAIDPPTAHRITLAIEQQLEAEGQLEINSLDLRRKTYEVIREYCGVEDADAYLVWRRFHRSGKPLILLIGGATGSGKSAVAAEVGYRLGLVRSQSTDMLREVMRLMLSPELMPVLYRSTYNAWEALPGETSRDRVIEGFEAQFAAVKIAIQATLRRAVTEMVHVVLDGIHVFSPRLDLEPFRESAVVVPVMLATLDKEELRERYGRRTDAAPHRRRERYLKYFDEIWEIQSYMLECADQAGIPIVSSDKLAETVQAVIDLVTADLARVHPPDPEKL
ncbi:MAG: hypothetical protein PVF51_12525 [Nitrospirota bacterium]|jgi:2-phosphoglycerate kinase